jgi:hypothetical protein
MKPSHPKTNKKIIQKVGVFLAHQETVVNCPRFTTNPPQLHHKNTTQKTHIFQNHPQKCPKKRKKSPGQRRDFFSTKSKKLNAEAGSAAAVLLRSILKLEPTASSVAVIHVQFCVHRQVRPQTPLILKLIDLMHHTARFSATSSTEARASATNRQSPSPARLGSAST